MLAPLVAPSLCVSAFPAEAGTNSERYSKKVGKVALDVVRLNMAGGRFSVKIGLARGFPGADEPFKSMVSSIDGMWPRSMGRTLTKAQSSLLVISGPQARSLAKALWERRFAS